MNYIAKIFNLPIEKNMHVNCFVRKKYTNQICFNHTITNKKIQF